MQKYIVTKTVVVEYYYNVEARNNREAIEEAENRTLEDSYQWQDTLSVEAERLLSKPKQKEA